MQNVTLRRWKVEDSAFTLKVRNNPDLMKWFRQDEPLTLENQKKFIESDWEYNGQIIEVDGKPVGLCSIKRSGEFTIGLLPQYHGKGIARKAMKLLLKKQVNVWSEVFVGNPALYFFLSLGFKITGVKERAYYKKELGLVDVVTIRKDK